MAKPFARRLIKVLFIVLTSLVMLAFVLGCLSQWISTTKYWVLGFASLSFPYTAIVLLLLCIFWFIAKPKFGFVLLLFLCLGFHHYKNIFSFNKSAEFVKEKNHSTLRLITWNIQGFNGLSKNKEAKKFIKTDIQNSIAKYTPDIVCLQEFNTTTINEDAANNIAIFSKDFGCHFFSNDYQKKSKHYESGCVIFSKYPIIKTGKIKYPANESLIFIDIVKGRDTVRVYTTHLQSFKFKKEDYDEIDNISNNEISAIASMNVFRKMKLAFKRRGTQADLIKKELAQKKHATIFAGDFNDVPSSYTYNAIKGDMKDAFLEKQMGLGRTFVSFSPTLRIDYVLADKEFDVQQFEVVDENLSDHLMLVCDLQLRKK